MGFPIVLATLNARYSHSSFGLRYIYANLGELQPQAVIREFTIAQNPRDVAEAILALEPRVVGLGVYIWNARQSLEVVAVLKGVRPDLKIVLGGPEVSYETETQEITRLADLTIQGEGDLEFARVCREYLTGGIWPASKAIQAPLPEIAALKLPYAHYSDHDIKNRVIYVEASRGCPYQCEYCLSSLDKSVRGFDLPRFLAEMETLIERGARQFKFIDRTFNLSLTTSSRILEFFLNQMERRGVELFLHFEMVPDRLPEGLRALIARFPRGALQFEIGIQTWNPAVAHRVSRRQDYEKIQDNLRFLAEIGTVHTHADLIAGLPGETLESFAAGFDALAELRPDEIQVGLLKRLKGTPIVRHDEAWGMVYQTHPPFQILQTKTMSFATIQAIGRLAHFWDLVANSGNFVATMGLIRELALGRPVPSLYREFERLVDNLSARHPQGHSVALLSLVESVWLYLTQEVGMESERVRVALVADYTGPVSRDVPRFLRAEQAASEATSSAPVAAAGLKSVLLSALPERQRRHRRRAEQGSQVPSTS